MIPLSNLTRRQPVRRRLREWLIQHFAADSKKYRGKSACRCFRCGILLTVGEVRVDRINTNKTFCRGNIRPACDAHLRRT